MCDARSGSFALRPLSSMNRGWSPKLSAQVVFARDMACGEARSGRIERRAGVAPRGGTIKPPG